MSALKQVIQDLQSGSLSALAGDTGLLAQALQEIDTIIVAASSDIAALKTQVAAVTTTVKGLS